MKIFESVAMGKRVVFASLGVEGVPIDLNGHT